MTTKPFTISRFLRQEERNIRVTEYILCTDSDFCVETWRFSVLPVILIYQKFGGLSLL